MIILSETLAAHSIHAGSQTDSQSTNVLDRMREFRVEFGPSRKDILNFTTQLAVMVRAGISLQECLESIASETENQKFKAVITDLKCRIEGGQSLSQALAEHADVFNDLFINKGKSL